MPFTAPFLVRHRALLVHQVMRRAHLPAAYLMPVFTAALMSLAAAAAGLLLSAIVLRQTGK